MPATSISQQQLMGMALAYKRGELKNASEEVKKLAKNMTEKQLRDFAKTKHEGLPDKVKEGFTLMGFEEFIEENAQLNPGMNMPGMGPVSSPGAPGTNSDFHNQTAGSGDMPACPCNAAEDDDEEEENKKKKKKKK